MVISHILGACDFWINTRNSLMSKFHAKMEEIKTNQKSICHTKFKEHSLPYYLPIARRTNCSIHIFF